MICSLYTIWHEGNQTLGICDFDSDLLSEPEFHGMQAVQVEPLLRADYPAIFARGNVERSVELTRVYHFATSNDARDFELRHMAQLDTLVKGRAYIEVKGGSAYYLQGAVLVGEPEPKSHSDYLPSSVAFRYTLYGGQLLPAPLGGANPLANAILSEAGSYLTTEAGASLIQESN